MTNRGDTGTRRILVWFRAAAPPRLFVHLCRAAMLLGALCAGCGVLSPEEQLLRRFFEQSRLHDTSAVAEISAVTFNPRTDGVVQDFHIADVAEEGDGKRVTVSAPVRLPNGAFDEQTLVFRIVRKDDRWFIAEIRRD